MNLFELAKGFLVALGSKVEEKDSTLLVAERPGLGDDIERTCVWILTQQARQGRPPILLEDEYLGRFKGTVKKYPGAKLHLLVDTTEALSADFKTKASQLYRVRIQVPSQFFDMPFSWELAKTAASATKELVEDASNYENKRVSQAYIRQGTDQIRQDLVTDLFQEIEVAFSNAEARIWFVIAPAGQGKSVFFASLFGRLYKKFQESKRTQQVYPRPPLVAAHLREAAGPNVRGLIDAFMQTEFAAAAKRPFFNWMIDNRLGFLMFDGLDELISRDPTFLNYLEERITNPSSNPAMLICVRDSLFNSSDVLTEFLGYYSSIIQIFALQPWDRKARREHAWLRLERRSPRIGENDTDEVKRYLSIIENNPSLVRLASTPFYADYLLQTYTGSGALIPTQERELVEQAVDRMCRREYDKETIREDIFPISSFREWLEELAALSYQTGGVSVEGLRELADLATVLASRELSDIEQKSLVEQITMAPFLTRSIISGKLELTHEILAEFLAGHRFLSEFDHNPTLFSSRLSQRAWPSDSMLFPVLSHALSSDLKRLVEFALSESLTADGFRNLVQLLVLIPGGDEIFRGKRLQLEGARLQAVRFQKLNLDGVSFRGTDLTNTLFEECSLRNTRFEGAVLRGTSFLSIPEGGMHVAIFGDCEHFDSVIVGERRRIEDIRKFQQWLQAQTGREEQILGPCPTSRQVLFLFRKFIHVDGQGRRDSLDRRGVLRGRQEPNAASTEDCLKKAIDFGYFEEMAHEGIRRATGPQYAEMVSFVKNQVISASLKSLLDSLCRIPGCKHVARAHQSGQV